MGWLEPGDELGLEAAGLLWVQVANFLWDVDEGGDDLIVAFLWSFLSDTAGTADLDWELLALGVSDELAWLLLDVLGGTAGLVDGAAFLWALAVANLLQRLVALLHGLVNSLLLESDLASFLEVLLANFLLSWSELCDVSVVALFHVLVGALQDGVLLDGGDGFLLLNTAQSGVGIIDATAEVDSALDGITLLTSTSGQLGGSSTSRTS